jgi:DHA2 family multidrug resistance protein
MLVASRVVQGFAGGVLIPLVFSAVFLLFPKRQQGLATTIAGVLAVLAPTVGPVVGGWITENFTWHWLFLINILPGVIAITLATLCVEREPTDLAHARTLDWVALALLATALASLEIGLKEAPDRGWSSGLVLGLMALAALSGISFVKRTLGARTPIVHLRTLADRDFAIGCFLSFIFGIGLFGSVYLMPVFLGFVRDHGAFAIGQVMLVTGVAQLLAAPIAVQLERRIDARLLTAAGFALFALGLAMSCFQNRETDYDAMFWPQVVRGVAIMLCLLPPTRLALGHLAQAEVAHASGLFNLMRNLGGAIGIALIDTLMFSRAAIHGEALAERLRAGDIETGRLIGLPDGLLRGEPIGDVTPSMAAAVRPLIEKASLVASINEAWAMLAGLIVLGLLALPFASKRRALDAVEADDQPYRSAA